MKICFFFLLLLSTISLSLCEDVAEPEAPNTEKDVAVEVILTASPHITTAFTFPGSTKNEFIIGNPVELLLGFSNNGETAVNVTIVSASLRYPTDWRYFIQNYTKQALSVVIQPGQQNTFLYKFLPDPLLEPREFGFSAQVFYHDAEGGNFTSYFFNSTVHLVESSESIDAQTLFTYIGIVGVAGLVLFIIYKAVSDKKVKRAPKFETGTQNKNVIDDEWLEGTHAKPKSPKVQRSPTNTRKPKNQ